METISKKIKTIEEMFNEKRTINPKPLQDKINGDGTIFKTENNEIIYLELLTKDFTIEELVRFTNIMETLCEKYKTHSTAYIICTGEVKVQEMPIKSESDFTIKLAQTEADPCEIVLNGIKGKIKREELLDKEDIRALQMIPLMCSKDKRDYYRLQVFIIMNELGL